MSPSSTTVAKPTLWASYILSAVPVLLLLASATAKVMKPPAVVQGFSKYGFPESMIVPLGILEIVCTAIYLIPRTSYLGAILLTGYLGGAVVTTARLGDSYVMAVVAGILVWGGLYLRDPRLRVLIPWRR